MTKSISLNFAPYLFAAIALSSGFVQAQEVTLDDTAVHHSHAEDNIPMLSKPLKEISSPAFKKIMKIYTDVGSNQRIGKCRGNEFCNTFVALSQEWSKIPDNYRYKQTPILDIKKLAADGDGHNLLKGYTLTVDHSIDLSDAAEDIYYGGGGRPKADEQIFAQGVAVLLYIQDVNGWVKRR